jgi:2'-5' RNA ligase
MLLSLTDDAPAHTIPTIQRDYPEWHRGRQHYAVWAILVDSEAVRERIHMAREQLGDWLLPTTARQPHITVFVCGFEADTHVHDDDFTADQLAIQTHELGRLKPARFELGIGGLDSFASAAFLRIEDSQNALPALRQRLVQSGSEIRQSAYLAHLTIGHYRQRVAASHWRERAAALAELPPIALPVDALHYCTYEAEQLTGPLRLRQRIALGD